MRVQDVIDAGLPVEPGEGAMGQRRGGNNARIVEILHELACAPGRVWGVRELGERLDEGRSTVNRILMGLCDLGLARRERASGYCVGPRLRVLVDRVHTETLLAGAKGVLDQLAQECAGTALLTVYDFPRPRCIVAAVSDAPGPIRYVIGAGEEMPLHAGAAGRAILAEIGIDSLGEGALEEFTTATITDRDRLAEVVEEDKRLGYTVSVGQHYDLAAGLAAPFRNRGLVGAVSVTWPRDETGEEDLRRYASAVTAAAQAISSLPVEVAGPKTGVGSVRGSEVAGGAGDVEKGSALLRFERLLTALVAEPGGVEAGRQGLARRLGTSPATAVKLLDTLLDAGVARMWSGRVWVGPRLLQWAGALGALPSRAAVAEPITADLSRRLQESVGFAEFDREADRLQFTAVSLGTRPLHYQLTMGETIPLHAGAAGKAVLAYLPDEFVDSRRLIAFTEHTLTDAEQLAAALAVVREQGWASGVGERVPEAFGLAAPYFVDGQVAGSLTVTVPRHRVSELDVDAMGAEVRATAQLITDLLSVR
jgi:DNA-binding IclR family transcriptional regulator